MKKYYALLTLGLCALFAQAQNGLLSGAITGNPIAAGGITDFELVYDGTDMALVIGDRNTGKIYAIDYNGTDATGVHDWETNQVDQIVQKIANLTGNTVANLQVRDMVVNPKTEAVVLLVFASNLNEAFLVEVKNQNTLSVIDLSNVTYSELTYTQNGNYIFDLEWGDDQRLYFCTGDYTLDAEVGAITPPFVHNSNAASRATTVFKSNWGGGYFTEAPLERITMAKVKGEDRLMGVTTCAPGFSIPVTEIDNSGSVLTVTEDFNVRFDPSFKVVALTQQIGNEERTYLFDLHWNASGNTTQLIRIGQRFLDGSAASSGEVNNNSQLLRNGSFQIVSSLTEEEAKLYTTGFVMITKYDPNNLMVIDDNSVLRLMDVAAKGVGIAGVSSDKTKLVLYPQPATDVIKIKGKVSPNSEYTIFSSDGKQVAQGQLNNNRISTAGLANGFYVLSINAPQAVEERISFQVNY